MATVTARTTPRRSPVRGLVRLPALSALAAAVVTVLPASPAGAGDWELTKGVTLNATYSDNANLSSGTSEKQDDLFLQVQPFFTLEGEGGGLKGRVYYLLSAYTGTFGDSEPGVANFLDASATAEIVRDVFYVDAKAKADMGANNPLNASGIDYLYDTDQNVAQRFGISIAPYAQQHLGSQADVYGRVGFDGVYYGEETTLGGNSSSVRYDVGLKSRPEFQRVPWRVHAEGRNERFDSGSSIYGNDSNYNRAVAEASYVLSPIWRLNGSVGYEQNDYQTTRDETSGTIWSVGGSWTPSERTSLTVGYGRRYFGPWGFLDFNHTQKRWRWYARFNREFSTVQREFLDSQVFFVTDLRGNPVLDPTTGAQLTETALSPQLTNETYLLDSFINGFVYEGNRTSAGLDLVYNQRSYELSGGDNTDWGVRARVSRELSALTTATASLYWTNYSQSGFSGQPDVEDVDRWTAGLQVARKLGRNSSVSALAQHRNNVLGVGGTGSGSENRVSLSFTTEF